MPPSSVNGVVYSPAYIMPYTEVRTSPCSCFASLCCVKFFKFGAEVKYFTSTSAEAHRGAQFFFIFVDGEMLSKPSITVLFSPAKGKGKKET